MEKKRVLVLGAGLVARPLVRYLLDVEEFEVTVASRTVSKAERLVDGHPRGEALPLDVENTEALGDLVGRADLAISLVPYAHHVDVARLCLDRPIPMVTTSYVSPQMQALDETARKAGVLLLNETGVDPGIDHMSAMKVIHGVESNGGKVTEFTSNTGGLPAPEANDNPWGYKFSWSPRGVLLAARNSATYLRDGEIVEVASSKLFEDVGRAELPGAGELEIYPNRNSLGYRELYGLDHVRTLFRGTFRYPGHCRTYQALVDMGWLDLEPRPVEGVGYGSFTAGLIGSGGRDPRAETAAHLGMDPQEDPIERMAWLGLFGDDTVPGREASPLDVLGGRMQEKLVYAESERDMIAMQHRFLAEYPDGRTERITSTMVDFGIPGGDSSMARTVSLPAAIAARLVLEGRIRETGVHIPVKPGFYGPILEELERMEIELVETVEPA